MAQPVADFLSHTEADGVRRILGETISHSGYIIMILQIPVSWFVERFKAIPTFLTGLLITAAGLAVLGTASAFSASMVFVGIFLFAVGEMIASPRIQEYITWIAPRDKAGLYMGTNFIATAVGGLLSGLYTKLSGVFSDMGHAGWVWYTLAIHVLVAIPIFWGFTRITGGFVERDS